MFIQAVPPSRNNVVWEHTCASFMLMHRLNLISGVLFKPLFMYLHANCSIISWKTFFYVINHCPFMVSLKDMNYIILEFVFGSM